LPQVAFPATVPKLASNLIGRLLEKDVSKRLGNMKQGGAEVKAHRFFEGTDWGALASQRFSAGSVLKPSLSSETDTSRFAGAGSAGPAIDDAAVIPRSQQVLFKEW
jgi:protein kinase A